jgi:hypothetical protein
VSLQSPCTERKASRLGRADLQQKPAGPRLASSTAFFICCVLVLLLLPTDRPNDLGLWALQFQQRKVGVKEQEQVTWWVLYFPEPVRELCSLGWFSARAPSWKPLPGISLILPSQRKGSFIQKQTDGLSQHFPLWERSDQLAVCDWLKLYCYEWLKFSCSGTSLLLSSVTVCLHSRLVYMLLSMVAALVHRISARYSRQNEAKLLVFNSPIIIIICNFETLNKMCVMWHHLLQPSQWTCLFLIETSQLHNVSYLDRAYILCCSYSYPNETM